MLTEEQVLSKCHVDNLSDVKNLNVWGNDIENIDIISQMNNVEIVTLSLNKISNLKPFANCPNLKELYLRKNSISDIKELDYLKNCKNLKILWLEENPICEIENYRNIVLQKLPQVMKLDNILTKEDKKAAEKMIRQEVEINDNVPLKDTLPNEAQKTLIEVNQNPDNDKFMVQQSMDDTHIQNILGDKTMDDNFMKDVLSSKENDNSTDITKEDKPTPEKNTLNFRGEVDMKTMNMNNTLDDNTKTLINPIDKTLSGSNKFQGNFKKEDDDYIKNLDNIDDIKNFFASPYNKNGNQTPGYHNNFMSGDNIHSNYKASTKRRMYSGTGRGPRIPPPGLYPNEKNYVENYANYKRQSEYEDNREYQNQKYKNVPVNDSLQNPNKNAHVISAILNLMEDLNTRELLHVRNIIEKKLRK